MRVFAAILKDSFREAVDGFVIYLMLAMSLLLIVLVASISFKPNEPEKALSAIAANFKTIFPDRGTSKYPTVVDVKYEIVDVRASSNDVEFALAADAPQDDGKPSDGKNLWLPKFGFRSAVFAWREPAGRKVENPLEKLFGGKGPNPLAELAIYLPPNASAAELQTVTDADMESFIQNQFATFAGIEDATVHRRAGVAEPEFRFDVALKGTAHARGWPQDVYVLFGAIPPIRGVALGTVLQTVEDVIVNGIGAAVVLILSVVVTAFFIPNLLRKGSVDLIVSKPIGRTQLLVFKYLGGLTFIFLLSSISIGGVWLVLSIRSGLWNPSFLLVIPVLTFTFAIVYSVSTAVAVFARNAIASIMVSLGFMLFLFVLGKIKEFIDLSKIANRERIPEWVYSLVDNANDILPRYKDLDKLTSKLVADSTLTLGQARLSGIFIEYPSWSATLGVSTAFIAILLAISCWRFKRAEF